MTRTFTGGCSAVVVARRRSRERLTRGDLDTCFRKVFKAAAASKLADELALVACTGEKFTVKQYYQGCVDAAKSFIHLGLERFESVCILGFNSPEWLMSNNGAIFAGGFAAGIYTTNEPAACEFIIQDSSARVVVVDGQKQLDKILEIRTRLPKLKAIVMYRDETFSDPAGAKDPSLAKVYTWKDFMSLGASVSDADLEARMSAQKPGHCCTLIYTSGTTGNPKGVMISHDNATWTAKSNILHNPTITAGPLRVVSYLPLSHIAAQIVDIHSPLICMVDFGRPAAVYFARPDALKGTLKETLIEAKPTVFFAVPRVWEKFAEAMQAAGKNVTGAKKKISTFMKGKCAKGYEAAQIGSTASAPFLAGFAKNFMRKKAHSRIGLDEARVCLTGAAPIMKHTLDYFGSIGIHILEVYGMSENTGPQNVCKPDYFKAGTCGLPIPGAEIKLDHVQGRDKEGEGEICFRGRHVMMGYLNNVAKTQESIDEEGWLHSGDVGHIDPNTNLLSITGRIKELIITAGGENIAPVPVEDAIKSFCPAISNVMMVGDKRKYNTALITLRQTPDGEGFTEKLFGTSLEVNPSVTTVKEAQKDAAWTKYIDEGIAKYNKTAVSNAQRIQKWRILDTDFSVPGGELTGTQKLKRNVVTEKYAAVIESMY